MKRSEKKRIIALVSIILALLILIVLLFYSCSGGHRLAKLEKTEIPEWISVQLLDQNGASTVGQPLESAEGIVVHYVANPGSTAQANRDFFNKPDSKVSAHFIVGLEGEIIQCIPLTEMSAASNQRNIDTISIEVCHPDSTGKFNDKTLDALIKLTAWLCDVAGFQKNDIIRHYDITGKPCPLYYVEYPDEWETFKELVMEAK